MKQGIYEAAVEVLMRDGLDRATMDRVALEAGIAKGSIYNYFEDKDHLLGFVFEKTIEPLQESIARCVESDEPVLDKMRTAIRTVFEFVEPRRRLFNFLMSQQAPMNLLKPRNSLGPAMYARLIKQGIDEGVFRPCDPGFHATLLYGAVKGIGDEYVASDEPCPADKIAETITRFCMDGLNPNLASVSQQSTRTPDDAHR